MPAEAARPDGGEWARAAGLRWNGSQFQGPCPHCGGTDRFHVNEVGSQWLAGCRGCIDGHPDGRRNYGKVLRLLWPDGKARERRAAGAGRVPRSPAKRGGRKDLGWLARRLWTASGPADRTPGHLYLARRLAWPPAPAGLPLPPSVRWIGREQARACGMQWIPDWTDGLLLFGFSPDGNGEVATVTIEGVDRAGRRGDHRPDAAADRRFRKTYGARNGMFVPVSVPVRRADDGARPTIVCEGEVTALAAAVLHAGSDVRGYGGTAALASARLAGLGDLVVVEDADDAGRKATAALAKRHAGDGSVRIAVERPESGDAADELARRIRAHADETPWIGEAWARSGLLDAVDVPARPAWRSRAGVER